MPERLGDTDEVKVEYRGGCGADTYSTDGLVPEDLPESAYVLEDGRENDFPDNPKLAIPDPEKSGILDISVHEIAAYLEDVMEEYASRITRKENIEKLKQETGESEEMIRYDAQLMSNLATEKYIQGLLNFGDTDLSRYMGGYQDKDNYSLIASPLGKGVNINAGHNIAAVGIPEVWRALTKNAVLNKMPSNDQTTLRILDEIYREDSHPVADSFALAYWPGGSEGLERNLFSSDYVMAWGNDLTIKSIQEKVSPDTKFIPFHFEFGAYLVDKETQKGYDEDLLKNITQDFSWGDQLLCFSPLLMILEESENTERFLQDLSNVLEAYKEQYPMGAVPKGEKMKNIRSKRMSRNYGELVSDFSNDTVVTLKEGLEKSDLDEFHNFRYIEGHSVKVLEESLEVLGNNRHLQEFILATEAERGNELREKIVKNTKANRIASPGGAAPQDPIPWDGKHSLNEFLRWISDERR